MVSTTNIVDHLNHLQNRIPVISMPKSTLLFAVSPTLVCDPLTKVEDFLPPSPGLPHALLSPTSPSLSHVQKHTFFFVIVTGTFAKFFAVQIFLNLQVRTVFHLSSQNCDPQLALILRRPLHPSLS